MITDAQVGPDASPTMTVETALEHARRAFALKKYEQAVEHYATALELQYVDTRVARSVVVRVR